MLSRRYCIACLVAAVVAAMGTGCADSDEDAESEEWKRHFREMDYHHLVDQQAKLQRMIRDQFVGSKGKVNPYIASLQKQLREVNQQIDDFEW